jgi:YidC/Oxa1 family membrane protein insertase
MDRRVIWAIVLMMAIAIAPTFFLEPPKKPATSAARPGALADADSGMVGQADSALAPPAAALTPSPSTQGIEAPRLPVDSVVVSSPLYRYVLSTRGASLVQASLLNYRTLGPDGRGDPVRLIQDGGRLHQLALTAGQDTVSLADWDFQASASMVDVRGPESVTFTASRSGVSVEVRYQFEPGDYQMVSRGGLRGLDRRAGTCSSTWATACGRPKPTPPETGTSTASSRRPPNRNSPSSPSSMPARP